MPYLAPRALDGLRDYQFKPGGYTHLDMLHQPLWNCELVAGAAKREASLYWLGASLYWLADRLA